MALAALLIALASRTFHLSSSLAAVAQAGSHIGKVQQLANDAHHWSAPSAAFVVLMPSIVAEHIGQERELLFAVHWDGCLYNRPPPPVA